MAKSKERKRFTEQQQRAAVADLSTMTIDEAAKKHGCSAGSLWTWKRKFRDHYQSRPSCWHAQRTSYIRPH